MCTSAFGEDDICSTCGEQKEGDLEDHQVLVCGQHQLTANNIEGVSPGVLRILGWQL